MAFGVSAIASYVKPNGQLVSLALTNLGTFVGAVCFFVGALLLLPERTLESREEAGRPPTPSTIATVAGCTAWPVSDPAGEGR